LPKPGFTGSKTAVWGFGKSWVGIPMHWNRSSGQECFLATQSVRRTSCQSFCVCANGVR